ncbi:hypothetical protein K432DRAFT_384580 [Lepidopterella palustris CBS 459.81]|uniref:DUF1772-domain-containing protein n=1 Tax=Lepidopterella palustris CBS 459.81 TaxID=1314670 RepID=A0A8E2E599_9PEZI|nr:hypothetical protein K432DRAFT_384580 [Lepidopterella palustris CBS 459.81]
MSGSGLFYHEQVPATVLIAQAVGITASAFLTGQSAAISYATVPSILLAPAPLAARQWKKLFGIGARVAPGLSIVSAVACGYLAYRESPSSPAFKLYAAAAVLVSSTIPYTLLLMLPTNKKLVEKSDSLASTELTDKAAEAGIAKEETVHALIDKWATFNLGRAILAGIGALCATYAVLARIDVVGVQEVGLTGGADRLG